MDWNDLFSKLDCLLSLGFSKETILLITCNNPYILLYSTESLISKFQSLLELSFSKEEVLSMIKSFPFLFGYDMDTIHNRILFLREIHLDSLIVSNCRILLFCLDLLKARYQFLMKMSLWKESNYSSLFLSDYDFYKTYQITKDSLLKGEF